MVITKSGKYFKIFLNDFKKICFTGFLILIWFNDHIHSLNINIFFNETFPHPQGDGNSVSQCQYTYSNHHESVLSLGFCERTRLIASCDSVIHLWDPFIGRLVSVVRNGYPVNTLVPLPAPHATLIAANTHASLNVIDTRTANCVSELKVRIYAYKF